MSRRKTSRSEQLAAAKACAEGYIGSAEAARRLKIDERTVREWVELYRAHGDAAFTETAKNRCYSTASRGFFLLPHHRRKNAIWRGMERHMVRPFRRERPTCRSIRAAATTQRTGVSG